MDLRSRAIYFLLRIKKQTPSNLHSFSLRSLRVYQNRKIWFLFLVFNIHTRYVSVINSSNIQYYLQMCVIHFDFYCCYCSSQMLCSGQYRISFMLWCSRRGAEIVAVFSPSHPILHCFFSSLPWKKIRQKPGFGIFQLEWLYCTIIYPVSRIRCQTCSKLQNFLF